MGALHSIPLCSRGRDEENVDRNNNSPDQINQNLAQHVVEVQPEATSTPKLVRVSEERGAAPASLSDSLESGPLADRGGGGLESDSGLEQSGDELELSTTARRRRHEEEEEDHEPDYDDDIDLDQEIPGLNSEEENDEEEDDNDKIDDREEEDNDERDKEADKRKQGEQIGGGSLQRPSRIPGGLLLRRRSDDDDGDEVDIARLEDEMSEPEAGLNEDDHADSADDEPLGKESTKDAITQMLSRLAVEGGGGDYQDPVRRDMTIR